MIVWHHHWHFPELVHPNHWRYQWFGQPRRCRWRSARNIRPSRSPRDLVVFDVCLSIPWDANGDSSPCTATAHFPRGCTSSRQPTNRTILRTWNLCCWGLIAVGKTISNRSPTGLRTRNYYLSSVNRQFPTKMTLDSLKWTWVSRSLGSFGPLFTVSLSRTS